MSGAATDRSPTGLPLRRRSAARVLVLTEDERLLLIHDSDPGLPDAPRWWLTPGGGLDPQETSRQAAVRELEEETGLRVNESDLVGPVWHRPLVRHRFSDHVGEQDEDFYVLRTVTFTPGRGGLTESERRSVLGHRWWTLAELTDTADDVWPRELARLLPGLLRRLAAGGVDGIGTPELLPATEENPRTASAGE